MKDSGAFSHCINTQIINHSRSCTKVPVVLLVNPKASYSINADRDIEYLRPRTYAESWAGPKRLVDNIQSFFFFEKKSSVA